MSSEPCVLQTCFCRSQRVGHRAATQKYLIALTDGQHDADDVEEPPNMRSGTTLIIVNAPGGSGILEPLQPLHFGLVERALDFVEERLSPEAHHGA